MKLTGIEDQGISAAKMPQSHGPQQAPGKTTASAKPETDLIELSKESIAAAKKAAQARIEQFREQAESAQQQGEARAKMMDEYRKCLLIASRIIHGDKVPTKDKTFLMEKQPDLYMQAVSLRIQNDHPKKHKRVSEDEEAQKNGASAAVDAPITENAGGEAEGGADVDGVAAAAAASGANMQT